MDARGQSKRNQRALLTFGLLLMLAAPSKKIDDFILFPPAPFQARSANWLEFNTDACGDLATVESRHSAPSATRASDDFDDDDEWVNAWNMPPDRSVMLNAWLSQHPEITTITSAVERACTGDQDPIVDFDTVDIA